MPIKNKDGSVYKLQGPNPLMKSQDLDGENVIIHNLNPEEVIGEDPSRQYREIPNPFEVVDIQQSVEEFMGDELPQVEEPEVQQPLAPKPVQEPPKVVEPPKPKPKQPIEGKLVAWCLPAILKEEVNPLYGEVKRSLSYGEKFSLETVVLNRSIVSVDFWSPVNIEKNSIIYLWEQREWWRVTKISSRTDGWVLTCFPSDHHPSF